MKHTNIHKVKEIAKDFLHIEIATTDYSPIVIVHPFFESGVILYKIGDKFKVFNIVENKKDLQSMILQMEKKIDQLDQVHQIFQLIRKSYRLTFYRYVYPYLSIRDRSEILSNIWICSENPNMDINVSAKKLIRWFRATDKQILMDKDEYEAYQMLPNTVDIYRGIASKSNPNGISWTTKLKTAEWFANRWDNNGYVIKAKLPRENVLAYYLRRGEYEIIAEVPKSEIIRI